MFSCRIVIISYKMLIITGISNEKANELTRYGILCQNITILPTKSTIIYKILLVLTKFSFWQEDWTLDYYSMKFYDFSDISYFPKVLATREATQKNLQNDCRFFISSARKIKSLREFKIKLFE